MITLARHIETLLLDHDCVVVPGFGGFLANYCEAEMEEGQRESAIQVPYRLLRFNPSLQDNDGLLVHSYMQAYDTAYPRAEKQMRMEVDCMRERLTLEGTYLLERVGRLSMDIEERVTFEPDESALVTPSLYGLRPLACRSVADLEQERVLKEALAETTVVPVVRASRKKEEKKDGLVLHIHQRWLDVAISAAAALVIFFAVSYSTECGLREADICVAGVVSPSTAHVKAAPQAQARRAAAVEERQPEVSVPAFPEETASAYTIVLASYVTRENAEAFIANLAKKGFGHARFVGAGKASRIEYAGYATANDAANALRALRNECPDFAEGWVKSCD